MEKEFAQKILRRLGASEKEIKDGTVYLFFDEKKKDYKLLNGPANAFGYDN